MATRIGKTWVVVADGARARIFCPDSKLGKLVPAGPSDLVSPASRQRTRELKSDRPGRGFSAARSGARHAFEPPHDYHKLEKHAFMAVVAGVLEDARRRGAFDHLILVAPRRSLGELRGLLAKPVLECVSHEVAKDLAGEPPSRLRQRLRPMLGGKLGSPPRMTAADLKRG
ncbi:MAG: host attachment protein [Reyranella sp.]